MNNYNKSGLNSRSPLNREVYVEQHKPRSRVILLAASGLVLLCVCLCVGIAGLGYYFYGGQSTQSAGLAIPFLNNGTATPTRSPKPTAIPMSKSAKDASGLQATVTFFQRPLPAQDVTIPDGQELVLVTVSLKNTKSTGNPLPYSSDDFKLVSPEGDSFVADTGTITTGEMLKKGTLAPGKSVKGDLIFYVYSDITDFQLVWESQDGTTRTFAVKR